MAAGFLRPTRASGLKPGTWWPYPGKGCWNRRWRRWRR